MLYIFRGVLWHGNEPITGASDVVNKLVLLGKKRFYFTNNNTLTRKQFLVKFKELGFEAEVDEILTSGWLTARYLKNIDFKKKVYLMSLTSLKEEFDSLGILNIGVGPENYEPQPTFYYGCDNVDLDPDVGAVVIGYDYFFSYLKIIRASSYLNNPDCLFLATNTDERIPITNNLIIPGTGTFVRAIEVCSERKAEIVGKPSPFALDKILIPNGLNPKRCLMIGDRCSTDIQFGNQRGLITLLVETGINKYHDVEGFKAFGLNDMVPNYYTSSIADLLKIINL